MQRRSFSASWPGRRPRPDASQVEFDCGTRWLPGFYDHRPGTSRTTEGPNKSRGGDGGPANGTAPHQRIETAKQSQLRRRFSAGPQDGACCTQPRALETEPLAGPRPARWVAATGAPEGGFRPPTHWTRRRIQVRSRRAPAQGGKHGLHRKSGIARRRSQTSDLPSGSFEETAFGRAEPPIPEGFRGSRGVLMRTPPTNRSL